jgi:hypothetical protein
MIRSCSWKTAALVACLLGPLVARAGPFDEIAGSWKGQAEYYANTAQGPIDSAHSVVPLTIEIDPGGKINGRSTEIGCEILGLVTAGPSPTNFRLQVSLTNCRAALMNRRYQGQLAHHTTRGSLGFSLSANSMNPGTQYSVTSTMTR